MVSLKQLEAAARLTFDPGQVEFIEARERHLIINGGRKTGKTECASAKCALDILNEDFSHTDGICVTSIDLRASKAIVLKTRNYLNALGVVFESDLNVAARKGTHYATMTTLFYNKGEPGSPKWNKMQAFACGYDGSGMRPYNFRKVLRDEDQLTPEEVDQSVDACLLIHGEQEMRLGMPAGKSGTFFDAWHDPDYRRWHWDSEKCRRIPREYLKRELRKLGRTIYNMEFKAIFSDAVAGVIPRELLAAAAGLGMQADWSAVKRLPCFMGVDPARMGESDNAIVFAWLDRENKVYLDGEAFTSEMPTTELVDRVIAYTKKYRVKKIIVDDNGLGAGVCDMLMRKLGSRVEGVSNQRRVDDQEGRRKTFIKVHMYTNMRALFENRRVILQDNRALIHSIKTMQYYYTDRGDLSIYGRDSHLAEAAVRALFPLMKRKHWFYRRGAIQGSISHEREEDTIRVEFSGQSFDYRARDYAV